MTLRLSRDWLRVCIFLGAGIAVAMQVGKVAPSVASIQSQFDASLSALGWIVGIFSLIAAGCAAIIGLFADRVGPLRFVLGGMFLTAAASLLGSFASSTQFLIVSRIVEGTGFLMTVASVPSLMAKAIPSESRKAALSLWGLYMPVGSFIIMVIAGPIVAHFGWREVWWIASAAILLAMVPVWFAGRCLQAKSAHIHQRQSVKSTLPVLRETAPLVASGTFAIYAGLYMALTGFLPFILISKDGFSLSLAASIGATVVLSNVLGNAASGWMHSKGVASSTLITWASVGICVFGSAVFVLELPVNVRVGSALVYGFMAGLVPSSLFASVVLLAPTTQSFSTVNGMLAQGSAIGQLTIPPLLAAMVALSESWNVGIAIVLLASAGLFLGGRYFMRLEANSEVKLETQY